MPILREVLNELTSEVPDLKLINADIEEDSLSGTLCEKILRLRLGESGKSDFLGPILVFGFQSFQNLLKNNSRYPRMLASPGVFYIQFPTSLSQVQSITQRMQSIRLAADSLSNILRDYAQQSDLSKMEAQIAHSHGNFLGAEKLLYGAYLAGMFNVIPETDAEKAFEEKLAFIRKKQEDFLASQKYLASYRLYQHTLTDYQPKTSLETLAPLEKGRILYIDDHAHLGWAEAVATALWGPCTCQNNRRGLDANLDLYVDGTKKKRLFVINRKGVAADEDAFKDMALQCAGNERFINAVDVVLLDLRLRYRKDEDVENTEDLSGIQVLKRIREINPAIPVVMLTASRKAKNLQRVLEEGADAYFVKEMKKLGESDSDIWKYQKLFMSTIKDALEKSYLSVAWRCAKELEYLNPDEFINWKTGYRSIQDIPDSLYHHGQPFNIHIDLKEHIILPIVRGIGLLKLKHSNYQREHFSFSNFGEAILNLAKPSDTVMHCNNVHEENKREKVYYTPKPFFPGEKLLRNIRNICAHGIYGSIIGENEAKLALYLSLRQFIPDTETLQEFATKTFGTEEGDCLQQNRIDEGITRLQNMIDSERKAGKKELLRKYMNFLKGVDLNGHGFYSPTPTDRLLVQKICSLDQDWGD